MRTRRSIQNNKVTKGPLIEEEEDYNIDNVTNTNKEYGN